MYLSKRNKNLSRKSGTAINWLSSRRLFNKGCMFIVYVTFLKLKKKHKFTPCLDHNVVRSVARGGER